MSHCKYLLYLSGLALLYLLSPATAGCAKEYSYERVAQDTVAIPTPVTLQPFLPACNRCSANNPVSDSSWLFTLEENVLCGQVEKAIISPDRRSFTFFGPSSCSADSGFIASVFLAEPLDRDKTTITAARVAFYYYDTQAAAYILMSKMGSSFSLNIDNYDHSTGRAAGTFTGSAFTAAGLAKAIDKGKFKIRFRL